MRIFIINLERSADRRLSLQSRCDELGLEVEFIEAVDGRKLTAEQIK